MQRVVLTTVLLTLGLTCPKSARPQNPPEPQQKEPAGLAAVAPVFPGIARAAHVKGDVVVEVKINSDGQFTDTK